jgi:glycosyltransferase involved in cell wall biosynthesis
MSDSYRRLTRVANRLTYRRNAALIAVSAAVAGSVDTWSGPKPLVITNGVSCSVSSEDVAAARAELGITAEAPLVTHVGNIRPGKGHDMLIDAARALTDRRDDVTWVSIGGEKYPGDLDRVVTKAERAGLGDHLRFLGRRADALAFVGSSDVYVNPSEVEGLPVSVLEAMSLGRPVVATAVGGVPGVIKDGETGLLVESGDSEALANGVQTLLETPDLAGRLGKEGQALVEREYGLAAMVSAVETVYEDVLS